ncbi:hypothetical protein PMIN03_010560 [Paraphaeosphaeria minitans]
MHGQASRYGPVQARCGEHVKVCFVCASKVVTSMAKQTVKVDSIQGDAMPSTEGFRGIDLSFDAITQCLVAAVLYVDRNSREAVYSRMLQSLFEKLEQLHPDFGVGALLTRC